MSELPRFKNNPFSATDAVETSPPGTPKRLSLAKSLSAIPRRLSISLTGERKPSVAEFHGDLVQEKKMKNRRKLALKVFKFSTIFILGLVIGIVIGYWAIPHSSKSSVSTTTTDSASVDDVVANPLDIEAEKARAKPKTPTTTSSSSIKSTSTPATTTTAVANTNTAAAAYWKPTAGTTFQIELSAVIGSTSNLPGTIEAYETDLFDTPASTITNLHAAGKKVICYFSAGTAENWRTDYSDFTSSDLGASLDGWPGENWVYTPSSNVRSIMLARLQLAKSKGCDAVDPDNVDVYSYGSESGFSDLTTATSIDYLNFLTNEAHALGLSIGLKNAGEILPDLVGAMDFSISESCVQYNECSTYEPFVAANKPAFNIQYPFSSSSSKSTTVSAATIKKYCTGSADISGFTILLKHQNLDAWIYQC